MHELIDLSLAQSDMSCLSQQILDDLICAIHQSAKEKKNVKTD